MGLAHFAAKLKEKIDVQWIDINSVQICVLHIFSFLLNFLG